MLVDSPSKAELSSSVRSSAKTKQEHIIVKRLRQQAVKWTNITRSCLLDIGHIYNQSCLNRWTDINRFSEHERFLQEHILDFARY